MPLFDTLHVYAPPEAYSAAMNMAIDEALLQSAALPSLRFYGWREPSISFGYFGRFADVASERSHRDVVRRWTGGGIVFHGDDLTYSLALPASAATRFPSPRAIYSKVHEAIRHALGPVLPVALASSSAPKISEACFANPVEADVLLNGRKIAGAALRRTRIGLLHQGSIQHHALPVEFPDRFAAALCASFQHVTLTPELLRNAEIIAACKYNTRKWLERR